MREGGSRIRRRVKVKYEPAGPGEKLKAKWDDGHANWNTLMADAARALVDEGVKPTVEEVIKRIARDGQTLTTATAARHVASLEEERGRWQELHGKMPEWNREARKAKAAVGSDAAHDQANADRVDVGADEQFYRIPAKEYRALVERAATAEARYERCKAERDKFKASRDRLAADNVRLTEENRRLGLAFAPEA